MECYIGSGCGELKELKEQWLWGGWGQGGCGVFRGDIMERFEAGRWGGTAQPSPGRRGDHSGRTNGGRERQCPTVRGAAAGGDKEGMGAGRRCGVKGGREMPAILYN